MFSSSSVSSSSLVVSTARRAPRWLLALAPPRRGMAAPAVLVNARRVPSLQPQRTSSSSSFPLSSSSSSSFHSLAPRSSSLSSCFLRISSSSSPPAFFLPPQQPNRRRMASSSSTISGGAATDGSPNNVSRSKTSFDEVDKTTGEFKRQPTTFRHWVKLDGSTEFPPEAGRYHLYVSYACPWASRCLLFRSLKGLEEAIPVHTVAPRWGLVNKETGAHGWVFTSKEEGETGSDVIGGISCVDELNHCKTLRELYELAVPDYNGKYTVPVLWDSKTKTIVNNESSEIIQMFNREFNSMAKNAELDLCPPELENYIKELNDWMYDTINNGVYRCGFATTQEAYESAFKTLFEKLDEAEAKLGTSRYLCGNTITEADIRLFVTIVRFDPVYVGHFKCNKKRIVDHPHLWGWVRDVYQHPGVAETVNMHHIKHHYYGSHPKINPTLIVPVGPDIDYSTPHHREKLF